MKTEKELNSLKEELETLDRKLEELTEDELKQIYGGSYMKDGRTYSDDPPHYLITTAFNKCDEYIRDPKCKNAWFDRCYSCLFSHKSGATLYCHHFLDKSSQ